jgi:hypothetical protein
MIFLGFHDLGQTGSNVFTTMIFTISALLSFRLFSSVLVDELNFALLFSCFDTHCPLYPLSLVCITAYSIHSLFSERLFLEFDHA